MFGRGATRRVATDAGTHEHAFARQVERIFGELYPLFVFTSVASPKWQSKLKKAA